MRKLIILTLFWSVFLFPVQAFAITINDTSHIEHFVVNGKELDINRLRAHTVTVYQRIKQSDGSYKYTTGAGISIDKRHVLTVWHTVSESVYDPETAEAFVEEQGGHTAYWITVKSHTDELALLEIAYTAPDMDTNPLPIAKEVTTKDFLYTFGHPGGNKNTFTTGKLGTIRSEKLIPLDMRILPGYSGGGVVNQNGELVGMVTSKEIQIGNIGYMVGIREIKEFIHENGNFSTKEG